METTDTTEMAPPPDQAPRAGEEIAAEVAARLGETEPSPRTQIKRAARILGPACRSSSTRH